MHPATIPAPARGLRLSLVDPPSPHRLVRHDLDRLSRQIETTLRHATDVFETKLYRGDVDSQRDALHLIARIEALARQVEHAEVALERIERRESAAIHPRRSDLGLFSRDATEG